VACQLASVHTDIAVACAERDSTLAEAHQSRSALPKPERGTLQQCQWGTSAAGSALSLDGVGRHVG
jgi:hypothetical protein